jgi:hypothetical protein
MQIMHHFRQTDENVHFRGSIRRLGQVFELGAPGKTVASDGWERTAVPRRQTMCETGVNYCTVAKELHLLPYRSVSIVRKRTLLWGGIQ